MKKRLLSIIVLASIVFTAGANSPKLRLHNKLISEPITAKLKGKDSNEKAQVIISAISTTSKLSRASALAPVITFPYKENFDNADITTDGWLITDPAAKMSIGSLSGLSALSGSSYLISGYDATASRNAWAFSPSISLKAGVTYHVYIYVYAPGYGTTKDEFKVTVGTNRTSAAQTTVLIDKTGTNAVAVSVWTKYEATFTPTADGVFNFGINHCTVAKDLDAVAFENFVVSNNVYFEPPIVSTYATGGLWSASTTFNDSVYLARNQPLNYIVKLKNATSFSWAFDAAATASSTTDSIPSVTYAVDGAHKATLNAVGPGGSSVLDATYYIVNPVPNITSDIVSNFKSYDSYTNSYFTDNNYVVGPNIYYKKVAEKYSLPSDATISISNIYFYVGAYNLTTANQALRVTISIVKANGTEGLPGTVVSTVTPTYSSVFGTTTITASTAAYKLYTFAKPVTVQGSFYIVVDFSTITTPGATDYLGLYSTTGRKYTDCSLYLYYNNAWSTSSSILDGNDQMSAFIAPTITFIPTSITSVENPNSSSLNAFVSENELHIQNATAGSNLIVYDFAGHILLSQKLITADSVIPVSLKKGIYLLKVGSKTSKVIVN